MPCRLGPVLGLMLSILVAQEPALAQTGDDVMTLRKEIETLQKGQMAIQRQLQELLDLVRGRAASGLSSARPTGTVRVEGAPFRGDAQARVTVVEFSDYQCPFCGRHFRETLAAIDHDYIETGKVRYVFRDLPIASLHPQAFQAAEAAHCAGDQGKYWEMHDRLFANQSALGRDDLSAHASALGLDLPAFEECMNTHTHASEIQQSLLEAQQAGAGGTPTFFLGVMEMTATSLRPSQIIVGAQPYSNFKAALDSLLSSIPR
jgi:protein-disulfide isomerase